MVLTVGLALIVLVYGISTDIRELQGSLTTTVQAAVAAEFAKEDGVVTRAVQAAVAAAIDRSFLQESIGNAVEKGLGPVVEAKSAEFTKDLRERSKERFGLDQTKQFPQGAGVYGPGRPDRREGLRETAGLSEAHTGTGLPPVPPV